MIKFLPSFVGSKARWVSKLEEFKNEKFVEAFCGSAVLSANLASETVLIDIDPYITKILSEFDQQIIIEPFGPDEYFEVRKYTDWWRYAYCLQRLSFSGVFRYSKNGYNVPIKSQTPVYLRENYQQSLSKWQKLKPIVKLASYETCVDFLTKDTILILDPPYKKSQASYNVEPFDYEKYWKFVDAVIPLCKAVVVFERLENLPFNDVIQRTMRVNGKHAAGTEGMKIFRQ